MKCFHDKGKLGTSVREACTQFLTSGNSETCNKKLVNTLGGHHRFEMCFKSIQCSSTPEQEKPAFYRDTDNGAGEA